MGAIDTYPPQNVSAQTPVLAFSSSTTTQSSVGSETDVTGCTVTVTVPGGRRIKVIGRIEVGSPSTNLNAFLLIRETTAGNAEVGRSSAVVNTSTESTLTADTILTPSAGVHTYKLTLQTNTGTINTTNISSSPNFILIEDITGSQLPVLPQSVPVGRLGYAELLASQTGITSTVQITGLSVNVSVPAGRVLRIKLHAGLQRTVADGLTRFFINRDGTTIQFKDMFVRGAAEGHINVDFDVNDSPTAGAHVYTAHVQQVTGTGTSSVGAAVGEPAFLMVEDISPTPAPGQGAPGSTLGYAEQPSALTGLTTALTDVTGLSVQVTVPDGRRLRIRGHVIALQGTAVENKVSAYIQEGATKIGFAEEALNPTVGTSSSLHPECIITPTAGTHTYKIAGQFAAGSSNQFYRDPTNGQVCYILVEDITGAVWPVGSTVTSGLIASEPWSTWTPSITQGVAVTSTIATARYIKMGRVVHCYMRINVTSSGTSGQDVIITLPVPGFAHGGSAIPVGSGWVYDSSTTTMYEGSWGILGSGLTVDMASDATGGNAWGIVPAIGLASGDIISFGLTYEAAS